MTAVSVFIQRMLWRTEQTRTVPEPVIALLGPKGSGKSKALEAMKRECGTTLVHAAIDFKQPDLNAIAAVGVVAFQLMSDWPNLPTAPVFHRVGLTLLALNEAQLNERLPNDRVQARARIQSLIKLYAQETQRGREADREADLISRLIRFGLIFTPGLSATPETAEEVAASARPAIGALLGLASRDGGRLRSAQRWLTKLDQVKAATLTDALINVSLDQTNVLSLLMDALLADLMDNAKQHHFPVQKCHCRVPTDLAKRGHDHAWVLLVDNPGVDPQSNGQQFLRALIQARQKLAAETDDQKPQYDPLLVVVAVDQWLSTWNPWWVPPWQTHSADLTKQSIPLLSEARPERWKQHADGWMHRLRAQARLPHLDLSRSDQADGWFPVWLDGMDRDRLIALAGRAPTGWTDAAFAELIGRLSGGLPRTAVAIRGWLDSMQASGGWAASEPVSPLRGADPVSPPLWSRELAFLLPSDLGLLPPAPEVIAVATYLLEPGRVTDDVDHLAFSRADGALRLLRSHLWISTFHARPSPLWSIAHGSVAHPAMLHPWVLRCLLTGLTAQSAPASIETDLFARLYPESTATTDLSTVARSLYYALARDDFDAVVKGLAEQFVVLNHRQWVGLLDDVTAAPCQWPALESAAETFARLAPEGMSDLNALRATIANLLALLWLYRDPLTVPTADLTRRIHRSFIRLSANDSARGDTSALEEAAERFAR